MFRGFVTDIFFDLDHTLWDFERNSALTFEIWKLYREEKITKTELRYQRLKSVFDDLGYGISDDMIHVLSEEYIQHLSSYNHLFPSAIEVLNYLQPKYRLHIITNGFQEIQDKKLRNSNIDGYFDHVINSEMAGVKKPNPIIFELALKNADTVAEKSLMIGDSLEADILGAKAVGFHTLHFNGHNEPQHDLSQMIHDLSEIKTLL